MALRGCKNGVLYMERYDDATAFVGLYIAGSTLFCLVLMVSDLIQGLKGKRFWIPCNLFSFNSMTLMILSVATKLSTDLSAPMPSDMDQISKITSIVFLCVSMGFMMPSIVTVKSLESIAQVAALSILVITISVDVGIQLITGVIFQYVIEHVVLLVFVLLMLLFLWSSALAVKFQKDFFGLMRKEMAEKYKNARDTKDKAEELKKIYIFSNAFVPQLMFCEISTFYIVSVLSILSVIVLLEASSKSVPGIKERNSCGREASDYRWSIVWIVAVQSVAIAVGILAISTRLWLMLRHMCPPRFTKKYLFSSHLHWTYGLYLMKFNRSSCTFFHHRVSNCFSRTRELVLRSLIVVQTSLIFPCRLLIGLLVIPKKLFSKSNPENAPKHLSLTKKGYDANLLEWRYKIAEEDFGKLSFTTDSSENRACKSCVACLIKDMQTTDTVRRTDLAEGTSNSQVENDSCLSLVALVLISEKISKKNGTPEIIEDMKDILKEAFDIIHFTEEKKKICKLTDEIKWILARDAWEGRENKNHWAWKFINIDSEGNSDVSDVESFSQNQDQGNDHVSVVVSDENSQQFRAMYDAVPKIEELKQNLEAKDKASYVVAEFERARSLYQQSMQNSATPDELKALLTDTLRDKLKSLLVLLPDAIADDLMEYHDVYSNTRLKRSLEFLHRYNTCVCGDGLTCTRRSRNS